jgi:hypothetical protein
VEKQMGQFIKFGLCTKIVCSEKEKSKIEKYYKSFDNFIADFEKQSQINTKIFNLSEEDNGYILTIKEELLESGRLIPFLKDFFGDIYDEKLLKIYCDDIYTDIETKNSADDLIKFAEEKPHQNFQLSYSRSSVIAPFSERIYMEYEYIVLFLNGKADMECYNELFSYMEKLLRLRHTHPQVWAMKVFLD